MSRSPTSRATSSEEVDKLYAELKPEAAAQYVNYFLTRTPPELQTEMKAKIAADLETPPTGEPDPTVAQVSNGASVVVLDDTGAAAAGSPGTASVANSALVEVTLGSIARGGRR